MHKIIRKKSDKMNNYILPIPPTYTNNYFYNVQEELIHLKEKIIYLEKRIDFLEKKNESNYLKKDDNYYII